MEMENKIENLRNKKNLFWICPIVLKKLPDGRKDGKKQERKMEGKENFVWEKKEEEKKL